MKKIVSFVLITCFSLLSPLIFADEYKGELSDTTFFYKVYGDKPYVFSIGYIENNSNYPIEDVTIAVQYYNKSGDLIDAAYESFYSLIVQPGNKVAFKVQTFAASEKDKYITQDVHIVNATQDIPCNKNSNSRNNNSTYNLIKKIFINWFPLILLIIVWIFLARKYAGKGSNQQKLVELMEKQLKFDEARNIEMKNIVKSLETIQHKNE